MKLRRREGEDFNISFLDVICCGFGAIILLLMITKVVEPIVLEDSTRELEGSVNDLQDAGTGDDATAPDAGDGQPASRRRRSRKR